MSHWCPIHLKPAFIFVTSRQEDLRHRVQIGFVETKSNLFGMKSHSVDGQDVDTISIRQFRFFCDEALQALVKLITDFRIEKTLNHSTHHFRPYCTGFLTVYCRFRYWWFRPCWGHDCVRMNCRALVKHFDAIEVWDRREFVA